MTKADAIQVYQTYIFVIQDWLRLCKSNAFFQSKNDVFIRRLESSLGTKSKEFRFLFEISESSWKILEPQVKSSIQEMSDFIVNYPPPEENAKE